MSAGRRSELLTATLVVLAATVVVTWPLAAQFTTHVSGHWDSFFSVWRLAWIADALRSSELQLFEAPIFFPQPHSLALSDAVLLPGLVSAPMRYAGVNPTLVYNIILFAAFASSGATMFLLVRTLSGRRDAATIAAVIYSLAPYRLLHLDHLEMQMAAWMPLALWLWHRTVDEGRAGAAAAAVGGVVLQWLSCIYYGLLFAPFLAVMMAVEWMGIARERRLRVFAALAAAAVAGVAVIAIYSMPYLDNRAATGDRKSEDVALYSATLASYIAVPSHNAIYARWLARFDQREGALFPGVVAGALGIIGLAVGPWRRRRWAYVAAGVLAFDLSLGTNGLIFPVLREWVLPFRGLRSPARAGVMVLLVISVLAGSGAAYLLTRLENRRHARLFTLCLILLLLVEFRNPPDLWEPPRPVVEPTIGLVRGAVVVEMPMAPPERLDLSRDADYMVSRIGAWPSLVNGYSGYYPEPYVAFAESMRSFPDPRSIREMVRMGVDVLAVHERWYGGPRYREIVSELNARTDVERVGEYLVGEQRVAVYQVMK